MRVAIEVLSSEISSILEERGGLLLQDESLLEFREKLARRECLDTLESKVRSLEEARSLLEILDRSKSMSTSQVKQVTSSITFNAGILDKDVKLVVIAPQVVEHIKIHSKVVL